MMKNNLLLIGLLPFLLIACGEENLNDIAENQFVIEAFLYAGEPIDDIRIKTTYPLTESEDTSSPINTATVTLIKEDQRYPLIASGTDGFYHYPDTDLEVKTNDQFQLEVIHNGITASAETIVPTPTTGLSLSQDSLFVPDLPFGSPQEVIVMTIREFLQNSSVEATWDNPAQDLYFMVVESVGEHITSIFPAQVTTSLSRFRFVSEPTDAAAITFLAGTLETFGTYLVKVYHINQEYADLYENREQDSRDLNEPPSNVTNALGVFSAFNSQEAFFEVVDE